MKTYEFNLKGIPEDLYHDLKRVKELDNRSMSSIIREGTRLMVNQISQQISENRKKRNSRIDMVGF
tara:strand:- start:190 stop:387 length:198 start_codon:yes stop_codon:yes gene_type:complete